MLWPERAEPIDDGTATLYVSAGPDRTGAQRLDGHTVTGDLFVFVARSARASDTTGLVRVSFELDGAPARVEETPPFDLGGSGDVDADPFDVSELAPGDHELAADIELADGTRHRTEATFTLGGSGPAEPPTTTTTLPEPPPGARPRFAEDSFWYTPIPRDVELHPRSADLAENFDRQWREYYGSVAINTDTFAPPIYRARFDTPRQRVRFWDCQDKGHPEPELSRQLASVPIPPDAKPSDGTDAELVIWQPSTDTMWELWKVRIDDGQWEACWGGRLTGVSRGQGVFRHPFGTTATGLSLAGGLITPTALEAGQIDHALAVSLVETRSGLFSWPANRTDGWIDEEDSIPEGLRLRLDPAVDVDALPISPVAKIVARALQTYGMVIRDKSGAVNFYAENYVAAGKPDPYAALFGSEPFRVLEGIPWDRLQALPVDYGKP